MVNDTIGDFLTRIRNAQLRKKEYIEVESTRMIESIAQILKAEGFIVDFSTEGEEPSKTIKVFLKYVNDVPAIREMSRVSKPGVRKYRGYKEIKPVMNGLGVAIFSTPRGVITGEEAVKQKVGGEYICYIF